MPVLFVLDEFHVLGHMSEIERAAGLMAGYGVKLWVILQDLGQLKQHYKEGWETFIGNAGVILAFGNTDHTTLDYLSKKLGNRSMVLEKSSGAGFSALAQGASATQEQLQTAPLLMTHEIEQLFDRDTGRVLVLAAGQKPVFLRRAIWYEDENFRDAS